MIGYVLGNHRRRVKTGNFCYGSCRRRAVFNVQASQVSHQHHLPHRRGLWSWQLVCVCASIGTL